MVDALDFAEIFWDQLEYGNRIADNTIVETDTILSGWRSHATFDLFGLDPIAHGLQDVPEEADHTYGPDPETDDGE